MMDKSKETETPAASGFKDKKTDQTETTPWKKFDQIKWTIVR